MGPPPEDGKRKDMGLEEVASRRYVIGSEAELARVTSALRERAWTIYGGVPDDAEELLLPELRGIPFREPPTVGLSEQIMQLLEPDDTAILVRAGVAQDRQLARLDLALLESDQSFLDYATVMRLRQAAALAQLRESLTDE